MPKPDNTALTAALDASLRAGMEPVELAALLMARKRLMEWAVAKQAQPVLETTWAAKDVAAIQEFLFAPLPVDANPMYGLDLLVQTVCDTAAAGNAEDVLFAALRAVRKAWGMMPHLARIESLRRE